MAYSWPAGPRSYTHDQLPQLLFDQASMHAQRAIELIGTDEAVFQAISIGTAVELLAKSSLAAISFGLVGAEKQTVETVLALDGKPRLKHGLPVMQSAVGKESIARLTRANPALDGKLSPEKFEVLLAVRNAAIHMGLAAQATNVVALATLVEMAGQLLAHRPDLSAADKDGFWGESNVDVVAQLVVEAQDLARVNYAAKIAKARSRYLNFVATLKSDGRADVINQFASVTPSTAWSEQVRSHPCPACENMGWIVYDVTRGPVQTDFDGDADFHHGVSVWVELLGLAMGFECNVCALDLSEDDELEFAGIPRQVVLGEDDADAIETGEYAEDLYDEEKLR